MASAKEGRLQANFGRGRSRKRRSRTKPRGRARPSSHICPRCGQFRGFTRAFQKQRKTALGRCGMKKARRFKENGGFRRKIRGEYRKMVKEKEKFALWITPECKRPSMTVMRTINARAAASTLKKQSYFIPAFYTPKKQIVTFQSLAANLIWDAGSICRAHWTAAFKLAVEQNVNNHILASDTDIDARNYQKMRGLSMEEVKKTNGRIDFEDALLQERGV